MDLLQTVRHLKDIGVEVRFEKEHINSMSGDGELMLTILASFAQEESRSLSENCKWGIRKRFEKGIPNGHFRVYGYRWEGDDLVIVPEEAEIVRRIFQNFLDGKSRLETEREFAAEGITTREGCRWVDSNIKVVLTNVTYTGNLLLQKEFISDPISKQRKKNKGQLPQYYVEDTHPAIIDKATFDYVQSEIARRKELGPRANKSLNLTCFSGMLKCPYCGQSYQGQVHTGGAAADERTHETIAEGAWESMAQRKVTAIPATISRYTATPINSTKKRRVAGYARVSTDHEDQTTSYEAQVDYYTNYIKSRDDWEFVAIYTDEGISATNTKKREGFKTMIADALAGKIEIILPSLIQRTGIIKKCAFAV